MIFLDLHKVYNSLDKDRGLKILEIYGVGPSACGLLSTYWGQLTIVSCAGGYCVGGYFGTVFKGDWGRTKGDLLSLTISNVVVDAVVRHWLSMVIE